MRNSRDCIGADLDTGMIPTSECNSYPKGRESYLSQPSGAGGEGEDQLPRGRTTELLNTTFIEHDNLGTGRDRIGLDDNLMG